MTNQAKELEKKTEKTKESSQTPNSLAENIKTKEQAEVFKRMLKAIQQ